MQQLTIVKIGGNIIDDDTALTSFLQEFKLLLGIKILVHGGGKLATELQEQLKIPLKIIDGRRITDAETLKIVTMVYAGYINKNIVAQLQSLNCNALGLSGADANCIVSKKREEGELDFGFVGDVSKINTPFISSCLENNLTPVFSAITHNNKGQLLNTNADSIASELAIALSKTYDVQLVYCFEKSGVLKNIEDENSEIKKINTADYLGLKERQIINKGMIPKLDNAFKALNKGVKFIQIGKAGSLMKLIVEENYEGTRICN